MIIIPPTTTTTTTTTTTGQPVTPNKFKENPAELLEWMKANGFDDMAKDLVDAKGECMKGTHKHAPSSSTEDILNSFITSDCDMIQLKNHVRILSMEDDAVLIMGESGTGKEIIAKALHGSRKGSFVSLNCAGLPEALLESELFGHKRGAFTGATADKHGLMSVAKEGTLFLDEIGDLPLTMQAKLLRAIQEKRVRKVGANTDEPISCRFVSATHRDLIKLVEKGDFRLDLYYRLNTFELKTKPLHKRMDDVELLIRHLDPEQKLPPSFRLAVDNHRLLGNVRDLQAMIRRCLVLGQLP